MVAAAVREGEAERLADGLMGGLVMGFVEVLAVRNPLVVPATSCSECRHEQSTVVQLLVQVKKRREVCERKRDALADEW